MDDLEDIWSRLKPRQQGGSVKRNSDYSVKTNSYSQKTTNSQISTAFSKFRNSIKTYIRQRVNTKRASNRLHSQYIEANNKIESASHKKNITQNGESGYHSVLSQERRKSIVVGFIVVSLFGVVAVSLTRLTDRSSTDGPTPQSLGVNEQKSFNQSGSSDLPVVIPSFDLLLPLNRSVDDFRVVLVSPEGNAPAYTFIDYISGAAIQVTQQQVSDIPSYQGVNAVATAFQATNTIQVDETTVFYGINERSGIQSVIAEKEQILVLIVSSRLLPEEAWVSYIASLE